MKRLIVMIPALALTLIACQSQQNFNPNTDTNDEDKKVVTEVRQSETQTVTPDGTEITVTNQQTNQIVVEGPGAKAAHRPEHPAVATLKNASPELGTFAGLLVKAELTGLLKDSNMTLLAPTDAAMKELPPEDLLALNVNKARLLDFIRAHVIEERTSFKKLQDFKYTPVTMGGISLTLTRFEDGRFFIQSSSIVTPDRPAGRALVHVIDRPLVSG